MSQSSIETLIARHYVGLRLLIAQRAGDPNVAADILNEAACRTWEKWQAGRIERPELIAGYIFQVAMNLLRNHRRAVASRLQRRINTGDLAALHAPIEEDDRTAENQLAVRVRKLISSMSTERDQVILTRFYLDEEGKESICRELGLEPLQFDKVLHRARGRLRHLLESQGLRRPDIFSVLILT